jgi:type II secretory pathway component GspD/PulD (secretin)
MRVLQRVFVRCLLVALAFALAAGTLYAQAAAGPGGNRIMRGPMPPGMQPGMIPGMQPGMPVPGGANPAQPPGAQPGGPPKTDDGGKTIQRPTKPTQPPKPDELKVKPDEKGMVRFNFNGQPWPGVLEWLAQISGMSLDWQELPGDYLNLSTQRAYTVQDTRDLINMHLLARGFTLLRQGDMLTVANIKKLDPSLVPRLDPKDLEHCGPHEFAKVSFPLDWMMADVAVEELKPMKSPNGTLTPLVETNRVEAMDAVLNLREIYAVLKQEQSAERLLRKPREFVLIYARASDVRDRLLDLLGESKPPAPGGQPQNPDQAQQQAMMMARMQQQQQAQQGQPGGQPGQPPAGPKSKTPVTMAVNDHKNSILVQAPPDKMAMIAQAIATIDVPGDRGQSPLGTMSRMHKYPIVGVDPDLVVKTLQEIGDLEPTTRLSVDKKNKVIIAYASLADQMTIDAIVKKLSGSERKFAVRHLRRLPADYVAGTISFMMAVEPKKKKERQNPWSWGGFQQTPEPAERPNEFRVDADIEHNRLLLLANEIELTEVDNLLVKLGEIPGKGGSNETTRVIETGSAQETEELLDRIRRQWPSISPNPLVLPPAAPKKTPEPAPKTRTPSEEPAAPPARTTMLPLGGSVFRLAGQRSEVAADAPVDKAYDAPAASAPPASQLPEKSPATAKNSEKSPPPVNIAVGPDGKIIISSEDTQALDRLEELAAELAPPRKDYKIFHLKCAWAYGVALNLEEFFKEDKKETRRGFGWWWGGDDNQDNAEDDRRLSKRRKLKFISDPDTNSVLVTGADSSQLKTIEDLIQVYDQPPPRDTQSVRKTDVIRLRYAKAKVVADTVKEVFRDLLSSNDKALANAPGQQKDRTVIYDFGASDDSGRSDQRTPKFKGLLSIGVDDLSNTLVVSAPAYFFDRVCLLIQDLDNAASDNAVRVVKVGPGISAVRLQEVLDSVLANGSSRGSSASKSPTRKRSSPPTEKHEDQQSDSQSPIGE